MSQWLPLLSTLTSILFLLLAPFRLWKLHGSSVKVVPNQHGNLKISLALALLVVHITNTAVFSKTQSLLYASNPLIWISVVTSLLAELGLPPLLLLEHGRSVRPSKLVVVYLLASSACDAMRLVKIVFETTEPPYVLTVLQLGLKILMVIIESQGKGHILRDPYHQLPPEQTAGVLNTTFFWWINHLLERGSHQTLDEASLPSINQNLLSKALRRQALRGWDQRSKPESRWTLMKFLVCCLAKPFASPILPRLFLIVFRYAQPILISNAIRFITLPYLPDETSERGFLLIVMTVVVYSGLAISTAMYQHSLNQLKVMIRGTLVGLIHSRSLRMPAESYHDGRAVTLMSTDADNIGNTAEMFHETWAQVVEVILGMTMLARQVGWVWPIPLIVIFLCSRMSRYVATNLQSKQKAWNVATQERIGLTSAMLSLVKSLKIVGMIPYMEDLIQNLRMHEIDQAKRVRWIMVAYNASANALGIFAPVITLVLFAVKAKLRGVALDAETVFTTMAILGLVTHPANMIMTIVPQALASLADFERVQEYLLEQYHSDGRIVSHTSDEKETAPAICVEGVTIVNPASSLPILQNISFTVNAGSTVICSGAIGSGKSTLAQAILGEVPVSSGQILVSTKRIGYCSQSPWLPNSTIREAITGLAEEEERPSGWYERVIAACCLDEDIRALPDGDATRIGSRGLNLSGGQRQRLALARAVYSRCEILILDDSFSALDGRTESRILASLFGCDGLFKTMKTTVFLISNSEQHFRFADWVVVLGDSGLRDQGTWDSVTALPSHLAHAKLRDDRQSTSKATINLPIQVQKQSLVDAALDLSRSSGDMSLYSYYFRCASWPKVLLMVACTACYSCFVTLPQYWLKWWTEAEPQQIWFYTWGYIIISLIAWTSTNGTMLSTYILIAPRSGAVLHQKLLSTIVGAPLSYFSATDVGVILNRFSQDIQLVDRQLPATLQAVSNQIFKLIMQIALLFSAQKYMAITLPFCMAIVYVVQRIYLRTSRQLRLLELESRSAVYSNFLESIEGIATIRAFGWESAVEDENIARLDISQQPFYILLCLQRWLNIVLDLLVAALAVGVILLAVVMKGTVGGGQIGVALNIVLTANITLLRLVESWTTLETSLGAISRIKSVETETPKEDHPWEDFNPSGNWPSSGTVEFENLKVAYRPDAVALRDINLKIDNGQKCIVSGRTGSGKSTLILSLLRLLDAQSGAVKVDGIDLSHVPRTLIRQRCFITIPQDPLVLGQATLRFNLDPSRTLPDAKIIEALERTHLWQHFMRSDGIAELSAERVLESPIVTFPPLSTGQSQLFSITRAVIQAQIIEFQAAVKSPYEHSRPKPILLLDEATSSLDAATESMIYDIIQREFMEKGHTVIEITHKLRELGTDASHRRNVLVKLSNGKVETEAMEKRLDLQQL